MSAISDDDVAGWREAIGREAVRRQRLDVESLRRFALAVDADPDVERILPPLAHWAWFLDGAPDAELGEDGHPRRGGFLPAIPLPRRMFAASTMRFAAPLRLDEPAALTMRIADVQHKSGRSGDLLFVEVDRTITQHGATCVEERQSLVYRDVAAPVALPDCAADAEEGEVWRPSTVNLFRFSAVTFNGHRIHYDRPYATGVEGYPALIVHGPFAAVKLAGLAMRRGTLASFAYRAQAPLFVDQPIRLRPASSDEVEAVRCDGAVSATARISYR